MPELSPDTMSTTSSQTGSQAMIQQNETMSTQSADLANPSGWMAEFSDSSTIDTTDNQSASFAGIRSEPGTKQSRRSIERDALRKYCTFANDISSQNQPTCKIDMIVNTRMMHFLYYLV